jgi:hypothetical protein
MSLFFMVAPCDMKAQVRKTFTQRTAAAAPNSKLYNIKETYDDWKYNLTLNPYSNNSNNNGNSMIYVDVDSDSNTYNSSSSTCLYRRKTARSPVVLQYFCRSILTGKSQDADSFTATKRVQNGTQTVNTTSIINHNQTITDTNYRYRQGS